MLTDSKELAGEAESDKVHYARKIEVLSHACNRKIISLGQSGCAGTWLCRCTALALARSRSKCRDGPVDKALSLNQHDVGAEYPQSFAVFS